MDEARPTAATRAEDLADRFRTWTGATPEGVWRAPGRVNLIGEHLDYNGGHVLPFAIDRSAWLAARRRPDRVLRCRSAQYRGPVEIPIDHLSTATGWARYVAGVMWALAEEGDGPFGADVMVDSDVPQGAGLSSSAALECAMALAVADLTGRHSSDVAARQRLARAAQRAESAVAGTPVGIMDQTVSLLAVAGHAMFIDTSNLAFSQVRLGLDEAGYRLLAIDTGAPHSLSDNGYADRRRACELAAQLLGVARLARATIEAVDAAGLPAELFKRARHVVTEEARTRTAVEALRRGRFEQLGRLMTSSHRSMQIDFDNSTATLDAVVDVALDAGADGARMTGGGWGGTAIILVRAGASGAAAEAVKRVVDAAPDRPASVHVLLLEPAPGARREL